MLFKYVTNIRIRGYLLTGIRISIRIRGSSCSGIRICVRIRGASRAGIRKREIRILTSDPSLILVCTSGDDNMGYEYPSGDDNMSMHLW